MNGAKNASKVNRHNRLRTYAARQRTYKGNQICILPHIKGNGRNYRNPFRLQLQQQIAQLWALAGEARLGSLAHPPRYESPLQLHSHRRNVFLQEITQQPLQVQAVSVAV